tara:strand:+ start:422 stop:865 length:444 start_codon:yes stop_codon:yes gene_type:complete
MAKISTYVVHVPKPEDIVIGTQVYTELNPVLDNPTRNFTVQSIVDIAIEENPFKSLTTTGTSGVSTLTDGILNIPNYTGISSLTAGINIVIDSPTGDVTVSSPNAIVNTTDSYETPKVSHIVSLTQAEYTALVNAATIDANTLYVII